MSAKKINAYSVYLLFRFLFSLLLSMATVLSVVYHLKAQRFPACAGRDGSGNRLLFAGDSHWCGG